MGGQEKSYAIAKRSIERFLGSEPTAEPVITLDVFKAKIAKETWLIDLLHKDPLPEELRAVPSV